MLLKLPSEVPQNRRCGEAGGVGVSAKQGKVGDSREEGASCKKSQPKADGERPGGAGLAVGGHLEQGGLGRPRWIGGNPSGGQTGLGHTNHAGYKGCRPYLAVNQQGTQPEQGGGGAGPCLAQGESRVG